MIGYLRGVIRHKASACVLVDVNGVGYEVYLNTNTLMGFPESGSTVELYTHLYVREDAYHLYGFNTYQEREVFRILLSINKIGPKLALAILSEFSVAELYMCAELKNAEALVRVPGIGKKTSVRLMMDLHDKITQVDIDTTGLNAPEIEEADIMRDSIDALVVMGFSKSEARRAVAAVFEQADSTESAVRLALASLSSFAV